MTEENTPRGEIGDEARALRCLSDAGITVHPNGKSIAVRGDVTAGEAILAAMLAFAAATPAPVVGDGLSDEQVLDYLHKFYDPKDADRLGSDIRMTIRALRSALAATPASVTPDAGERERVDPELIDRVRYAVEHPDAKGFGLAKAGMTRHDFRRILSALTAASHAEDGKGEG
jgi:hypothetical protein